MEKFVQVLGHNGIEYEVLVTEGLVTFCRRLTEIERAAGLVVTFDDFVVHQLEATLREKRLSYSGWRETSFPS
jgi:hypothetical protein